MQFEGSLPFSQEPVNGPYPHSDLIHKLTLYFFKLHFNIIFSFTARLTKWYLPFRFPD
jgi:hypothetical protein